MQYTRLSITVSALQFTFPLTTIPPWLVDHINRGAIALFPDHLEISSPIGTFKASLGDYLIHTPTDTIYVCPQAAFPTEYSPIDSDASPSLPAIPESPPFTTLYPGEPSTITDALGNQWTYSRSDRTTLALNSFTDPFTTDSLLTIYANQQIYFQRPTGQWYAYEHNRWTESTDPRPPTETIIGPPATLLSLWETIPDLAQHIKSSKHLSHIPDLWFRDDPASFDPSSIALSIQPLSARPHYATLQRSDGTFIIPIWQTGAALPHQLTIQFRPYPRSYIRVHSKLSSHSPTIRTFSATDTISLSLSASDFQIIEIA